MSVVTYAAAAAAAAALTNNAPTSYFQWHFGTAVLRRTTG